MAKHWDVNTFRTKPRVHFWGAEKWRELTYFHILKKRSGGL